MLISAVFIFINLNLICANFTDEFYANWIEKYRKVSGNERPPNKIKDWIKLATEMNVTIEPEKYKPIFEHLEHFKKSGLSVEQVENYLQKVKTFNPRRYDIVGFSTRSLMNNPPQLNDRLCGDNFKLLSQVMDPEIECLAIVQKYDEGMVIPADDDDSKPYADMADVFKRSADMRRAMGEYADKHILLQAPTSFNVIPFYAPVFSVYRLQGAKDILFATEQTGIGYYVRDLPESFNAPSWENKTTGAMFRGSATGISYRKAVNEGIPLTNSPRFKLHQMSDLQKAGKLNCKVPLNFGVSHLLLNRCPSKVLKAVNDNFKEADEQNFTSQFKYKYLVVVDGNGAADRTAYFMSSGSLVFLSTVLDDWTHYQIVPGEHYIKIKPDLSDLIEKLEWAADNDAEAKRIAQNGKEFALNILRKPQRQIYNALLFMEYQALFDTRNSTKSN